jgi:hemerythrin-like domain-containing protein
MKATDILYEEHRIITAALSCLQKIVEQAQASGKLKMNSANRALDFFKNFADGCHHAKEEDRLFVVMEERGIPREGGPIGVMLFEHDGGRDLVRGMAQCVEKASQGDAAALRQFAAHARDFIALLSNHIAKEDQVLFPMAAQVLDGNAADQLLSDFKNIEAMAGGHRHREYIAVAKQLCEEYGVDFVDDSQLRTLNAEFLN